MIEEYLSDILQLYAAKDCSKVAVVCQLRAERFLKMNDFTEA
jgi:hypothetical protein